METVKWENLLSVEREKEKKRGNGSVKDWKIIRFYIFYLFFFSILESKEMLGDSR